MTRGRRRDTNRGPQFKTMHRDVRTREWAKDIQTSLRHYGGGEIADDEAIDYADQFWRSLEQKQISIADIVATPGTAVVTWTLAKYCAGLVATTNNTKEDP